MLVRGCINIHFFRKWWYNEAIYELHCLIFRNATMLLHKNVLLLQCQEFLESWNRRLYLSHSQAPIDFKTLSLRVSTATGAWKLINLNFNDKIHEKFQEICPETGRNWYKWLSKYQNYFTNYVPIRSLWWRFWIKNHCHPITNDFKITLSLTPYSCAAWDKSAKLERWQLWRKSQIGTQKYVQSSTS